jgi:serine/threonine protein kinase/ankyrin repeat protein
MPSNGDYRYKTRLHALIARGPVPSRRAWKDNILTYLTQNCDVSNDQSNKQDKVKFFASPLPVNVVPKQNLADELRTEENGFIPINLAVEMNCPSEIISALCELFPLGATVPRPDGSLPLHIASTRPTGSDNKKRPDPTVSDNLTAIAILMEVYPLALVARDRQGRTPLIRLLQNHASTRHAELIEKMIKSVDVNVWSEEVQDNIDQKNEKVPFPVPSVTLKKKNERTGSHFIPASALAIPDSINGALPIHYAAKNGATKEVISLLVRGYPASIGARDCMGRIPLHWCLGAVDGTISIGYENETIPMHHFHRSSNIISLLIEGTTLGDVVPLKMKDTHVSGREHRCAIHYAIELLSMNICDPPPLEHGEEIPRSCLTIKSLQMMIDDYREGLVERDALGCTPLHILFRTSIVAADKKYRMTLENARSGASTAGGESYAPKTFSPPMSLLQILLECCKINDANVSASMVADVRGMLPLHLAVISNTNPSAIAMLVENYPKSLIQSAKVQNEHEFINEFYDLTSDDPIYVPVFEDSRTPLHFAFASPFTARHVTEETVNQLLWFESSKSKSEVDDDQTTTDTESIHFDGSVCLEILDASGNTPLHLAAKNLATFDVLSYLLKHRKESALIPNMNGDLPLHLLLDEHFAFVNADIATTHGSKNDKNDAFEADQLSPEFREKVRELAKQQTFVSRLSKMNLCGAIFAPTNGWLSDDDLAKNSIGDNATKKINLLAVPLVHHASTLRISGSIYGLNCLQILLAFNAAPYRIIQIILNTAPDTVHAVSSKFNATAMGLHLLRKSIPNEVPKLEMDCWRAIKELIFAYQIFPIENVSTSDCEALQLCRRDKDLVHSLEQQIIAEITRDFTLSYHWNDNYPVNPRHVKLGLLNGIQEAIKGSDCEDMILSSVCKHVWTFFVTYCNPDDHSDQYASSVDKVFEKLSYKETEKLQRMSVPKGSFKKLLSVDWDGSILSVDNFANIYCKMLFHKYFYFAGFYDLSPTSESSMLIHRGQDGDSIIIKATQKEIHRKKHSDGSYKVFNLHEDARMRDDFYIDQKPVVFKLMRNALAFEKEVKWRRELSQLKESGAIVPMLSTFDPNAIDGQIDEKYQSDRLSERFQRIPLRNNLKDEDGDNEHLDMTMYPYAVVFPFATDGNLQETISRGSLDIDDAKKSLRDLAELLASLHSHDLIHGSISMRNILSFSERSNEGRRRSAFKLAGLTSLTPANDISTMLGAITPSGRCLFDSSTLPPEMFMKVDPFQLAFYNEYWKSVMELDGVEIQEDLIKPRIDPVSHETYVIKCFCNLDEEIQKNLPPLPYKFEEFSMDIDIWSFGLVIFSVMSNGEVAFQPNLRTGRMSAYEVIANWNRDSAQTLISQYINDAAAQDLLIHILTSKDERRRIDMHTVLSHPFFNFEEVPRDIQTLLVEARDERELMGEMRRKDMLSKSKLEFISQKKTHIGRLPIHTHIRLTNSISEVLQDAFDPAKLFKDSSPYAHIILPYELGRNKDGKLTPKTKLDVELAEKVGRQILDLAKALHLVSCYCDYLNDRDQDFGALCSRVLLTAEVTPSDAAVELLDYFNLRKEHYLDFSTQFVMAIREKVANDSLSFSENPYGSALDFITSYIAAIASTFSTTNKAYLYLVDEFSCIPAIQKGKKQYPHVFSDNVSDVVCKCLPYMHTCVSSALSSGEGILGLVKLIFEGAYPNLPSTWEGALQGLPTLPRRRRMVMEAKILHEAAHSMIPDDSPLALNGEPELNFLNSLFVHIDSDRGFGGLRPITDSFSTMWVSSENMNILLRESEQESQPDRIIQSYINDMAEVNVIREKEERIVELEKALSKLTKEAEKLRMG